MARFHDLEDEKRRILVACIPVIDKLATAELLNPDSEALESAIKTLGSSIKAVRKRLKAQLKSASPAVRRMLDFQDGLLSIAASTLSEKSVNTELLRNQILLAIKSSSDMLEPAKTL